MHLIDMDALGVKRCSRNIFSDDYCEGWNGLIGILETAPTVDAIPVDTLKQWLATIPFHDISNGNGACFVLFKEDFEKAIKHMNSFRETREPIRPMKPRAPHKLDTAPVVRCVDCVHFDPENYGGPTCDSVDGLQYPGCDDFCSNGERRPQGAEEKEGGAPDEP